MVDDVQLQTALALAVIRLPPALEFILSAGHDQKPEIGPPEDSVKEGHLNISLQGDFFSAGEISGCETSPFLVLAATDCPEVNGQIVVECRGKGILVNHGGDKSQCDFYFPAVAREGDLVIGLTAGGSDHKLVKKAAAWIRSHMKEMAGE